MTSICEQSDWLPKRCARTVASGNDMLSCLHSTGKGMVNRFLRGVPTLHVQARPRGAFSDVAHFSKLFARHPSDEVHDGNNNVPAKHLDCLNTEAILQEEGLGTVWPLVIEATHRQVESLSCSRASWTTTTSGFRRFEAHRNSGTLVCGQERLGPRQPIGDRGNVVAPARAPLEHRKFHLKLIKSVASLIATAKVPAAPSRRPLGHPSSQRLELLLSATIQERAKTGVGGKSYCASEMSPLPHTQIFARSGAGHSIFKSQLNRKNRIKSYIFQGPQDPPQGIGPSSWVKNSHYHHLFAFFLRNCMV